MVTNPTTPVLTSPSGRLDEQGRYVLEDYLARRPFASFLPGLAGPLGIPMWVFYTNRGQAIASFGIESKDAPILEFQPANKAYQLVAYTGFRTFIRVQGWEDVYEPFSLGNQVGPSMRVGMNDLQITERNPDWGLETNVLYFTLPGEPLAALVRQLTLKNITGEPLHIEVLDGLPQVVPYGVNNWLLKEMNRTLEAWMEVFNLEEGLPFYRVRASVADTAEVEQVQAGNFFLSFMHTDEEERRLPVIVDPQLIFGMDSSLSKPAAFPYGGLAQLISQSQVTLGKTPCGFSGSGFSLAPGAEASIYTLIGHTPALETLQQHAPRLLSAAYIDEKHQQAVLLAEELTAPVGCRTGSAVFDAYARQTFLDNGLRGGFPVRLGEQDVYHLYSRKHGDLERDYNAFFIAAEYYSQGNGSYRDVNQNRRSDVLFYPWVEAFNLLAFTDLLQLDGYNPLLIQGSRFYLAPADALALAQYAAEPSQLEAILQQPFTPGSLLKAVQLNHVKLSVHPSEFIHQVFRRSKQQIEARFGEGYWIDHWTYNLDQVETYLSIYPEKKNELLFENERSTYYDSPEVVHPRDRKYVLSAGKPRQLNAVVQDSEKAARIAARSTDPYTVRTRHGEGEIFRTTLFTKLFGLALIKFASLDPQGMGIEMEAGKPGWYDALNGLPGLFGSGMSETYELQRLLRFLAQALPGSADKTILLPVEMVHLLEGILGPLAAYHHSSHPDHDYILWDALASAREAFRSRTRLGVDGETQGLSRDHLAGAIRAMSDKVQAGIGRAVDMSGGLPPTYYAYQVDDYETILDPQGLPQQDPQGRALIRVKAFSPVPLPPFLEGPVRALKIQADKEGALAIYQAVRGSQLYDEKLHMYRLNASLAGQPHDIGRARAFPSGWLENGSIWLHMAYKYLLEVLKAGLYEQFLEDFMHSLVPFMDPAVYGRSPTENSSFLASSLHPDPALHGAGFVARLSGATAEFLSIWSVMTTGVQPFFEEDGELALEFRPCLPGWLFTDQGELQFTFLGSCQVTLHNPVRGDLVPEKDGLPSSISRVSLHLENGSPVVISGSRVPAPYARQVRAGEIRRIELFVD